jgi:hypothetical protein
VIAAGSCWHHRILVKLFNNQAYLSRMSGALPHSDKACVKSHLCIYMHNILAHASCRHFRCDACPKHTADMKVHIGCFRCSDAVIGEDDCTSDHPYAAVMDVYFGLNN